jgi:hypothetical protein
MRRSRRPRAGVVTVRPGPHPLREEGYERAVGDEREVGSVLATRYGDL